MDDRAGTTPRPRPSGLRLADVLCALSVVTDLGTGQRPEKALRAAVVGVRLAEDLRLSRATVADVYYATLLRHVGCTATARQEVFLFGGNELASRPIGERTDERNPRELLAMLAAVGQNTGLMRLRYLARTLRLGEQASDTIIAPLCEAGRMLAARIGLGRGVQDGIDQVFERWDGAGSPRRLQGEAIAPAARLAALAHQVIAFDRLGGIEAALAMVRRRAGSWFDPAAAASFLRLGPEILRELGSADAWQLAVAVEPEPGLRVGASRLDDAAMAFADFVDLQSVYTLGHSRQVAALADAAAGRLGLDPSARANLRRAGLFHDLGRVAVSVAIWERRSSLTTADWEHVRLHPYYSDRVLSRSSVLAPLARLAVCHHERLDGSGYPTGAAARDIPLEARILAAADVVQALSQERPHRPARSLDQTAALVRDEVRASRLDAQAAAAVLDVAGSPRARLVAPRPGGLSEREIEVLRLVARGLTNREIGDHLGISPRTAEHHVQHVYAKIGVATRAGAALFALEHDLLRSRQFG